MKRIIQIILAIGLIVSLLAACGGNDDGEALSEDKLVVGVTAGPHEEIFEVIQELAEDEGLEIEIKVYSDYIMPNTSLAEGDLRSEEHTSELQSRGHLVCRL